LTENAVNRILNVITYVPAAIYFLVDAVFVALIAGPDQVAAALSLTRIVFGARDHPLSSIATLISFLSWCWWSAFSVQSHPR
jgi:hypothetical protein